jgi:hypothetical protein
MERREEDELRRMIRKELETREQLRGSDAGTQQARRGSQEMSDERRRIIEDEIEAYYRARGDYVRHVNEDGDVEWLTVTELREREAQIPVDMEELEEGQRHVRNRLLALIGLVFLGAILLIVLLRDRTGTIQVICNVPGAIVQLDGSSTEFATDARLEHLTVGPHVIAVAKPGYVPDGQTLARVELRAGHTEIVVLKLKPGYSNSLDR